MILKYIDSFRLLNETSKLYRNATTTAVVRSAAMATGSAATISGTSLLFLSQFLLLSSAPHPHVGLFCIGF